MAYSDSEPWMVKEFMFLTKKHCLGILYKLMMMKKGLIDNCVNTYHFSNAFLTLLLSKAGKI